MINDLAYLTSSSVTKNPVLLDFHQGAIADNGSDGMEAVPLGQQVPHIALALFLRD